MKSRRIHIASDEKSTIDTYISQYPKAIREKLQKIRRVSKEAAPQVEEAISYGMPTFKLNGNLVHFAVFKKHIGFYPTPKPIEVFRKELSPYTTSKVAIQFPIDKPIPYDLIREIVKFRVNEILEIKLTPEHTISHFGRYLINDFNKYRAISGL